MPALAASEGEISKLVASDAMAESLFGSAVAIDAGTIVVGASAEDTIDFNAGAAYVFDAATGTERFRFVTPGIEFLDNLGQEVALDGRTAILSAEGDGDNGTRAGAAYLYDSDTGAMLFKLLAPDGQDFDTFGDSVDIGGGRAVVGASDDDIQFASNQGSAYVFDAATGAFERKLVASDGAAGDVFGFSIAISGNRIVVGAPSESSQAMFAGAVYVFDATTGTELFKLTASDADVNDGFGLDVALDGDLALIGAVGDDDNGTDSGSVYVYDVSTGAELRKLTAGDGAAGDWFGNAVAIDGDLAVIGARRSDDNGDESGSAYVFDVISGVELRKLLPSDGAADDSFGTAVGVDGTRIICGARSDEVNGGLRTGSAYIFELELGTPFCLGQSGCPCGNDSSAGGCLNSSGVGAVLSASGSASVAADDLVLTTTGCPPGNSGLYFMGGTTFAPVTVDDGLGCTGGLFRFLPGTVDVSGAFTLASPVAQALPGQIPAGSTRHFQSWTRDVLCGPPPAPCPSPCGEGSNLSSGLSVVFCP